MTSVGLAGPFCGGKVAREGGRARVDAFWHFSMSCSLHPDAMKERKGGEEFSLKEEEKERKVCFVFGLQWTGVH